MKLEFIACAFFAITMALFDKPTDCFPFFGNYFMTSNLNSAEKYSCNDILRRKKERRKQTRLLHNHRQKQKRCKYTLRFFIEIITYLIFFVLFSKNKGCKLIKLIT